MVSRAPSGFEDFTTSKDANAYLHSCCKQSCIPEAQDLEIEGEGKKPGSSDAKTPVSQNIYDCGQHLPPRPPYDTYIVKSLFILIMDKSS